MNEFSDDPFFNLPEDPELAFLQLEGHFRRNCEDKIKNVHHEERVDVFYVDYIAQVLAAITELNLQAEFHDRVPKIEDVDYNTYLNFNKDVKHYRTMLEIRHGRRAQSYSVQFDTAAKSKIRHHLGQVRAIIQKLEVEERKREDLFARLSELENEVDRDRTHFDRFAAFAISTAGVTGQAVEKSKLLELLDKIAQVFSAAWVQNRNVSVPLPLKSELNRRGLLCLRRNARTILMTKFHFRP
jgi:hypothetical protein